MSWLFGRRRGLSDLVTCIVSRDGDSWTVMWASEGQTPAGFDAADIGGAVERASHEVGQLYADHPERSAGAELQFAIYPWPDATGDVILDVRRDASRFVATDIQGSGIEASGSTLDELIAAAAASVPDPSSAMLRWIRPISELF